MVSASFSAIVGIVVAIFALRVVSLSYTSGSHGIISGKVISDPFAASVGDALHGAGQATGGLRSILGGSSRDGRHPDGASERPGLEPGRNLGSHSRQVIMGKNASLAARWVTPSVVAQAGASTQVVAGTQGNRTAAIKDRKSTTVVPVSLYSAKFASYRSCHLYLTTLRRLNCGMDGSIFVAEMRCSREPIYEEDALNALKEDFTSGPRTDGKGDSAREASGRSIRVVVGVKIHVFEKIVSVRWTTSGGIEIINSTAKQENNKSAAGPIRDPNAHPSKDVASSERSSSAATKIQVWDYCRHDNLCPAYAKWADLYESQYRRIYGNAPLLDNTTTRLRTQFGVAFGTAQFGESALRGAPVKCGPRRGWELPRKTTAGTKKSEEKHLLSSFIFPIVGGWEAATVETWLRTKWSFIQDVGHHSSGRGPINGHERSTIARNVLSTFKYLRKNAKLIHCDISANHLLYLAGKPETTMLIDFARMVDCERENLKCQWFLALQLWQILQLVACVCTPVSSRGSASDYCRAIPNMICQGWRAQDPRFNASALVEGVKPCLTGIQSEKNSIISENASPTNKGRRPEALQKVLRTAMDPLAALAFPGWVPRRPKVAATQNSSAGFARIEAATETLWRGLEDIFGFT